MRERVTRKALLKKCDKLSAKCDDLLKECERLKKEIDSETEEEPDFYFNHPDVV